MPEIETVMGGISLDGQLKRLEEDYDLVKKKRPILSKEGSQTVRYKVSDLFLRFWFRWQGKNNKDQGEIDIVGLYAEKKKALVAEVKRQSQNFKPDLFALKVEELRISHLSVWNFCFFD